MLGMMNEIGSVTCYSLVFVNTQPSSTISKVIFFSANWGNDGSLDTGNICLTFFKKKRAVGGQRFSAPGTILEVQLLVWL